MQRGGPCLLIARFFFNTTRGVYPTLLFFFGFRTQRGGSCLLVALFFSFSMQRGPLVPSSSFFLFFLHDKWGLPARRVFSFLFDMTSGQAYLSSCFFYSFQHDEARGAFASSLFFLFILTRRGPCLALLVASVSLYTRARSVHFFLRPSWVFCNYNLKY